VVHFKRGEQKQETARPYPEAAARKGKDRVVLIGVAQEQASIWKSWLRKGAAAGAPPAQGVGLRDGVPQSLLLLSLGFGVGAAFWKTNAYAPFPIWLWRNGHDGAKRQWEKAGIAVGEEEQDRHSR